MQALQSYGASETLHFWRKIEKWHMSQDYF